MLRVAGNQRAPGDVLRGENAFPGGRRLRGDAIGNEPETGPDLRKRASIATSHHCAPDVFKKGLEDSLNLIPGLVGQRHGWDEEGAVEAAEAHGHGVRGPAIRDPDDLAELEITVQSDAPRVVAQLPPLHDVDSTLEKPPETRHQDAPHHGVVGHCAHLPREGGRGDRGAVQREGLRQGVARVHGHDVPAHLAGVETLAQALGHLEEEPGGEARRALLGVV
eukprot:4828473-Pyramimonas_sp.AAC.2